MLCLSHCRQISLRYLCILFELVFVVLFIQEVRISEKGDKNCKEPERDLNVDDPDGKVCGNVLQPRLEPRNAGGSHRFSKLKAVQVSNKKKL